MYKKPQERKRKTCGPMDPFVNFTIGGKVSPASKKQFQPPIQIPTQTDRISQNLRTVPVEEQRTTTESVSSPSSANSSQQAQIEIVFCQPSKLQKQLYSSVQYLMTLRESEQRKLLTLLCAHPILLYQKVLELSSSLQHQGTKKAKKEFINFSGVSCHFPTRFELSQCQVADSGKLLKLFEIVTEKPVPKLIIASSYAKTLDLLEGLFSQFHAKFALFRINSNTPVTVLPQLERQISENDPMGRHKIILLNTKTERLRPTLFASSQLVFYDFDAANDPKALTKWGADGLIGIGRVQTLVTLETYEAEECSTTDSNSQQFN